MAGNSIEDVVMVAQPIIGPPVALVKVGRFGPYTDALEYVTSPVRGIPFCSIRNRFHQLRYLSKLSAEFIKSIRFQIILDDETPNARAWTQDGRHYVGITTGLMLLIEYYFLNILSIRGVLTQFPENDKEEEVDVEKIREGFFLDKMLKTVEFNASPFRLPVRVPKSRLRREIALGLATSAIEFVLWHEIGHCFHQHARILNEVFEVQESAMAEWIPESELCERQDARHLFELQADSFAIFALCAYALPDKKGVARKPDRIDDYAIWSLAIDSLFWIFSQKLPLDRVSPFHPHPQVRAWNKLQTIHILSKEQKFRTLKGTPLPAIKFVEAAATLSSLWVDLKPMALDPFREQRQSSFRMDRPGGTDC